MRDLTDMELIGKALASDQRAWGALVKRYHRKVYGTAIRIYGDHPETEDIVQETFLAVAKSLKNFRRESSFSTFLYSITVNTTCRYLKKHKKKSDFMINGFPDLENISPASEDESPFSTVEQHDTCRRVYSAVRSLNPVKRSAIVLYEIENIGLRQVANVFKEPVQTIWSRIRTGKIELHDIIKKQNRTERGIA